MKTETETTDQPKISNQLSLYYIEESLIGLIEAREMAETDEERAVCDEQMRLYVTAEVRKVDGILAMMRNCKARAVAAKTEAERLGKLERAWSRRLERLEQATLGAMQSFGASRLDGNLGAFCVRKNPPSVEIHNDSLVPMEYKTANIAMPADLWLTICERISADTRCDPEDVLAFINSAEGFTTRKADVAKELKRPDGYVAGARLVTDKVRLEVR